jgi:hypothetical protein
MDPTYHYSTGVLDSWMSFVATDTTMRIRNDLFSTATDSEMTVYSGSCGALTPIAYPAYECYFNATYGGPTYPPNPCATGKGPWYSSVCLTDLVVDATYYVKVGIYNDYCPDDGADPPNNTTAPVLVSVGTGDVCGDGWLSCAADPAEQCDVGNDGRDEMACDRNCEPGNTCLCKGRLSAPMLPTWGLAGLGLLLLAGGAMVFGRRRVSTA